MSCTSGTTAESVTSSLRRTSSGRCDCLALLPPGVSYSASATLVGLLALRPFLSPISIDPIPV